jgi:hypothetical protein
MPELTTFEVTTQLLHQETVGSHVCIMGIPYAGTLLNHQIGITETHNPADAYVLRHL